MRYRYSVLWAFVLLCMFLTQACTGGSQTASLKNDAAIGYLWQNLDSAWQYAAEAYNASGRDHEEKAKAMNTMARVAFMRMDYDQAWELYSGVADVSGNMLEVLASNLGLMRICQRTSDNVAFYEYRNRILLLLRTIHAEEERLSDAQMERLVFLERSFRMESARYYFELAQPQQADVEMAYVSRDRMLRDDADRFLMYLFMHGLGVGLDADANLPVERLHSLAECLRLSRRSGNVRMQASATGAICSLLLEYGAGNVLSWIGSELTDVLPSDVSQSDAGGENLPMLLACESLRLAAKYGAPYEMIEAYRLMAACQNDAGEYGQAVETLGKALELLNTVTPRAADRELVAMLEPYRDDGVIVEQQWMELMPHRVVPECMSSIRELMSLAFSGMDDKVASDYNRNVYLELQKTIRLDRRYEARTLLLEKSNRRLTGMLTAIFAAIVLLGVLYVLVLRRVKASNLRYASLMQKTVELCQDILQPVSEPANVQDNLNNVIAPGLKELSGADSIEIGPQGQIEVDWGGRRPDRDGVAVLSTAAPFILQAFSSADLMLWQTDSLKQAGKQHWLYSQHKIRSKRENLARKTCCQVVGECLPYIDRMKSQIERLSHLSPDSAEYSAGLEYVRELAGTINRYNDVLTHWISVRQGMVSLSVSSFDIQSLFDIVEHGSSGFKMKGVKLNVMPSDAVVRADRVLTLFMINTLADNARKFTPAGGSVTLKADETDDYVEISVTDTGIGLSESDVRRINEDKVLDADSIGLESGRPEKGSGFGLMNCKGIIAKYIKTDSMFSVCRFNVQSEPGKGSRFTFRLPKGVKRALGLALLILCGISPAKAVSDSLLVKAYDYADSVYNLNVMGDFEYALEYADMALDLLSRDYYANGGQGRKLCLWDSVPAAETGWLEEGFATDYETVLWLRNEVAVSALALRDWDLYRYNDNAYLKLFKLYYGESAIEQDCLEMQRSNSSLSVAVMLLVLLFVLFVLVLTVVYVRHWIHYRSDLKQVLRVVNRIQELVQGMQEDHFSSESSLQQISDGIFPDMDSLLGLTAMSLAISDGNRQMSACSPAGVEQDTASALYREIPLSMRTADGEKVIGKMGLSLKHESDDNADMLSDMTSRYLSTALYSCVLRFEPGFRDLNQLNDESRQMKLEEEQLHVNSLILDNCLSTLKHETVWYPNRILQLASDGQVGDMLEVVTYYREIFGILSQYALSETGMPLVQRNKFSVDNVMENACRQVRKNIGEPAENIGIRIEESGLEASADEVLVQYLLENILERSIMEGCRDGLALSAVRDGGFVRFELFREGLLASAEKLDSMFSPLENADSMAYVLCRQIIREHDGAFGHPGCRINAESRQGGTVIWFTVPSA